MKVRVLFFASYRDMAGTAELDVDLREGSTAGSLLTSLRERGGPLGALPERVAVAVNRSHAALDVPLSEGDEVALLPPVAGG